MMKKVNLVKRMGVISALVIAMCLGVSALYAGSWVTFDSAWGTGEAPLLTSPKSDQMQTVVDITIPGMWRSKITRDGMTFDVLKIPGYVTTTDPGKPALPTIGSLVAIPA